MWDAANSLRRRLLIEDLEDRRLLSGIPRLVANINQWGIGPRSIGEFVTTSEQFYFAAETDAYGRELWSSDGTEEGTRLVKDIVPGSEGADPRLLASAGDVVFLLAETEDTGSELWRSDGTSDGTWLIKELTPGRRGTPFRDFVVADHELYFTAITDSGPELWKSDGTAGGTFQIKDIVPGVTGSDPRHLTTLHGRVYFTAETRESGNELWSTDGTADGTKQLLEVFPGYTGSAGPRQLTVWNDHLIFSINDEGDESGHQLWITDGTAQGSRLLRDFGDLQHGPSETIVVGNQLVFSTADTEGKVQLWKSDGTVAGTVAFAEVQPRRDSGFPLELTPFDDRFAFFAAGEGGDGDLWISDVTTDGTRPLTMAAEGGPTRLGELTANAGHLFFHGRTVESQGELWVSDGTPNGTRIVRELSPGDAAPRLLTPFDNQIIFVASGPEGREVYRSNGTEEGTIRVSDIVPHDRWSIEGDEFVALGDRILFPATDYTHGMELWASDGTMAGTVRLSDINPGPRNAGPSSLTKSGDLVYFVADNQTVGRELWMTDGSFVGTTLVKDILPGSGSSEPKDLTTIGEHLFFATSNGVWLTHGSEATTTRLIDGTVRTELVIVGQKLFVGMNDGVWVTDGTLIGTIKLSDAIIRTEIAAVGDRLFFSANADNLGRELWTSDGTIAGTGIVKDINPNDGLSWPEQLVDVAGTLLFVADDGESGAELWKSDGTTDGTVLVHDVFPGDRRSDIRLLKAIDNVAYFVAVHPNYGNELWRSDGTPQGTKLVRDLTPGIESTRRFGDFTPFGEQLVFRANDQLWKTDGTAEGTIRLLSSDAQNLSVIDGLLYFTSADEFFGSELWQSDGTASGTQRISDINVGSRHANPSKTIKAGESILFAAETESQGRELWGLGLPDDAPLPLVFEPLEPRSATVFHGSYAAEITSDQSAVELYADLRAGQLLSLAVYGDQGLTPAVTVVDPNGLTVARVAPAAESTSAYVDGLLILEQGAYRIRIESADASSGTFTMNSYLNAVVERETQHGVSNDAIPSAEPLDSKLVAVSGSVDQLALIGDADGVDYFQVQLQPRQGMSLLVNTSQAPIELSLHDATGTILAARTSEPHRQVDLQEFVSPNGGTYLVRVAGQNAPYRLLVTRGAMVKSLSAEPQPPPTAMDGSHSALGYLRHGTLEDTYEFATTLGDELTLNVLPLVSGPVANVNTLLPTVQLQNEMGDVLAENTAANATLTHTAGRSGYYRVRVTAAEGEGIYQLHVSGSTGEPRLRVESVRPGEDAYVADSPETIQVEFSNSVLLTSVTAESLRVDRIAGRGVEAIDHDTLSFAVDNLDPGPHQIHIDFGALHGIHGAPVDEYQSEFTFDPFAPHIVATAPHAAAVLPPGDHTIQIRFDRAIQADLIDESSVRLQSLTSGHVPMTSYRYDERNDTLEMDYAIPDEGAYELRLRGDSSALRSLAGIALDGELVNGLPTGDGEPGGDFVLPFNVDIDIQDMPTFRALNIDGSLAYRSTVRERALHDETDSDEILLELPNNTLVSVFVDSEFQPDVSLIHADGQTVLASAIGGQPVDYVMSEAGPVMVRVASADGRVGRYDLQFVTMAQFETESTGGGSNDSLETAQPLRPFVMIDEAKSASQLSVVGRFTAGDRDVFRFRPNSIYSIIATGLDGGHVDQIRLLADDGAVLFTGANGGTRSNQVITGITPTLAHETVYLDVEGTGSYALIITQNAGLDLEPNDELSNAQSLDASGVVVGTVAAEGVLFFLETQNEDGLFVLDSLTGAAEHVGVSETLGQRAGLAPSLDQGRLFATNERRLMQLGIERPGVIGRQETPARALALDPANNRLYGSGRNGAFFVVDQQFGGVLELRPVSPVELVGMAFGNELVYGISHESTSLYAFDPEFSTWHIIGDTGLAWSFDAGLAFDPARSQLFAKRNGDTTLYRIDPTTAEVAAVGNTGRESGGGLALMPGIDDPTGSGLVVGGQTDTYRLAAPPDMSWSVTATPLGTVGGNELIPELQVFDPSGTKIGSDTADGTASATVNVPATQGGDYLVQIRGAGRSKGHYVLAASERLDMPALLVTNSSPPLTGLRTVAPSQVELTFNQPILASSVQSSDFTVDGVPAQDAQLIDGDTVRFSLPGLFSGRHRFELVENGIVGQGGSGNAVWTRTTDVAMHGLEPFGSWVYSTSIDRTIAAGETDTFLIRVDEPMNVSLQVVPNEGQTIESRMVDDMGAERLADRSLAGRPLTFNQVALETGVYQVSVNGDPNSPGNYSAYLILGGSHERESNDWIGVAQDIDHAFTQLSNGASRAAIVGRGDGGNVRRIKRLDFVKPTSAHTFLFDELPLAANDVLLTIAGRGVVANDSARELQLDFDGQFQESFNLRLTKSSRPREGFYQLRIPRKEIEPLLRDGQLHVALTGRTLMANEGEFISATLQYETYDTASDVYSLSLEGGSTATVAVSSQGESTAEVELWNDDGLRMATGTVERIGYDQALEFTAGTAGTYYVSVRGHDPYVLAVTRNATLDLERNNVPEEAQSLVPGGIAVGGIDITGTLFYSTIDPTANPVLAVVDPQTAATSVVGPSIPHDDMGLAPSDDDSYLFVTDRSGDVHRVAIDGSGVDFQNRIDGGLTGGLARDARTGLLYAAERDRVNEIDPIRGGIVRQLPSPPSWLSGIAVGNGGLYGIGTSSRLLHLDFQSLTWSDVGDTGRTWGGSAALAFDPANNQLYAAGFRDPKFYRINPNTADTTIVGTMSVQRGGGMAFFPGLRDPTGGQAHGIDEGDRYQLSVQPGDELVIETFTPFPSNNGLDPAIKLFDIQGNLLKQDDNGHPDGRNARLEHSVTTLGPLQVVVSGSRGTVGSYGLAVTGSLGGTELLVTGSDPQDESLVDQIPSHITVEFSDRLLPGSIDAGDLQINGVAATSVEIVDGTSLRFTLPPLLAGFHQWTMSEGALRSSFDRPLQPFRSSFYAPPTRLAPGVGRAFELAGTADVNPDTPAAIPIPLDDEQTFGAVIDTSASLAIRAELLNRQGTVLATVDGGLGQEVLLPTVEIGQSGTHLLRLSSLNSTSGQASVRGLLNASLERESITGEPNDTPATAEHFRTRNVDRTSGGKLGFLRGTLETKRTTVRRLGALHGGSGVVFDLALGQSPVGPGELLITTSGDMRGASRFLTVDVSGIPSVDVFVHNGTVEDNIATIPLESSLLESILADDGVLRVRIEPSRAVGDQPGESIGARIDYPTVHFTGMQTISSLVGGVERTTNLQADRNVVSDGFMTITARGDFTGEHKTLSLRVEDVVEATLFANEVGQDGVFTANVPLSRTQLINLVRDDRRIGVAVKPSQDVPSVVSVELQIDYDTARFSHAESLNEGFHQISPTHFRIAAPQPATSNGMITVTSRGVLYTPGAFLELDLEGLVSRRVFGSVDQFDLGRATVPIPLEQSVLDLLQEDGFIDVVLTLSGSVDFESDRFVEVALEYSVDEDFYEFELVPGQRLTVGMDMQQFADDAELSLWNSSGDVVENATRSPVFENHVVFEADAGGAYYLRAAGRGDYSLVVGSDVSIESEQSEAGILRTRVAAGEMSGHGGLLFSVDGEGAVFTINSDTGMALATEYSVEELWRSLLIPDFKPRDLFAAVDHQGGSLYRLASRDLHQLDLHTGALEEFIDESAPVGSVAIAYGNSRLYAVSEQRSELFAFDLNSRRWSIVGDTGHHWLNGGLAYDDAQGLLYAKRENDQRLYSVDPRDASIRPIGNTGILEGGDLAFFQNLDTIDSSLLQSGDRVDDYPFEAAVGDELSIELIMTGRGPLHPRETEITFELLAPSGKVLAGARNDAGQAQIYWSVGQSGRYTVRVTARGSEPHAYQLRVNGATKSPVLTLVPLAAGSGVFHARIDESGLAEGAADFVLGIDAGQTISIVRDKTVASTSMLSLIGPTGNVLGTVGANSPDGDGDLRNIVSNLRGNYTLRSESSSRLVADVYVGAAAELEDARGRPNNSPLAAEGLDELFVSVSATASRAGVVGTAASGEADYFQFEASAGDVLDLVLVDLDNQSRTLDLKLENGTGQSLAQAQGPIGNFARIISRHVVETDTTHFVRVEGMGRYVLVATRNLLLNAGQGDAHLGDLTEAIGSVQPGGVLFFAEEDGSRTLWVIDTDDGTSWPAGLTGGVDPIGLAPIGSRTDLIGSFAGGLGRYGIDGADVRPLLASEKAEGLAYDVENHQLYGIRSGSDQFYLYDVETGATIRELADPPLGMSGLAFGKGRVYGLGVAEDSFDSSMLYAYDPNQNKWSPIGSTQRPWREVGLAYNSFTDKLYAKQGFDSTLYEIDPVTAEVSAIGDTGIRNGGGLAFVPHVVDPTGNNATFGVASTFFFTVAAAANVEFVVEAPVGASLENQALDARLELFDQAGNLLAADEDGATDGVNTRLRFFFAVPGRYTLSVGGESGSQGDFRLTVNHESIVGDANRDGRFDQLDVVQVLQSAKYLTGRPSSWRDGDWNSDGFFDQLDIVFALQSGDYLRPAQDVLGDANRDGRFDQLDIVQVLQSAKYVTGERATWHDGDWNGDGLFDQLDIVAALQAGNYRPKG